MSVHQLFPSSTPQLVTLPPDATLDDILMVLERDGGLIIRDLASPELIDQVQTELAPYFEAAANSNGPFWGYNTKRLGSLIARSPACCELLLNPTTLTSAKAALAPFCDTIQLNQTQAIKIEPGEVAQVPHSDDLAYPVRADGLKCLVNALWAITDFTQDNGATRVAPGSHNWPGERSPLSAEQVPAVMTRGSVLLYYGATRHNGGANTSSSPRIAVVMSHVLGWLRQNENQYLAVPRELAQTFPEILQELLGYAIHRPNLGFVDGHDPKISLEEKKINREGYQDYLPDHYWPVLEHYRMQQIAARNEN